MRKTYLISLLLILLTSSCKSRQYLLIEPVKGKVVSSADKKPVAEVKVYVDRNAFNAFDTVSTNAAGTFFVDKMTVRNYKDMHLQNEVSYNFFIEKEGYKKVMIDVRKYRKNTNPTVTDTIDLGLIYLEAL